jgi:hypothetical protein
VRKPFHLTAPKRRSGPEAAITMQIASGLRAHMPTAIRWTHFPAGEARDERTGAKLKAMGLNRGWPDFIGFMPDAKFWAIEVKADKGRLTLEQGDMRDAIRACGGLFGVARSWVDAREILEGWLAPYGLRLLTDSESARRSYRAPVSQTAGATP